MKKLNIFIAATLLGLSLPVQAQFEDDEITVTNEQGEEEVIELPEGMTSNVDSLLQLYHTKKQSRARCRLRTARREPRV